VSAIQCIVFSRDRAMQLDAFLESVSRWSPDLFSSVTVLYRATTDSFDHAYETLAADRAAIRWTREWSFRDDLIELVGDDPLTVFHTDDDAYFRTPEPFELRTDEVCFSLRLGLNTTYSYSLGVEQRLIGAAEKSTRLSWDWRSQCPGELGYPLAVNGHVFRTSEVVGWLRAEQYANPNELESRLQYRNPYVRPRMASLRHSCVVSIPANLVNETNVNRHGNLATPEELNERFLRGERIDVVAMDFSVVRSAHQEIAFAFRDA
jgi:hypothetical protein